MSIESTMLAICFCARTDLQRREKSYPGDVSKIIGQVSLAMLRVEGLVDVVADVELRAALAVSLAGLQFVHAAQAQEIQRRADDAAAARAAA